MQARGSVNVGIRDHDDQAVSDFRRWRIAFAANHSLSFDHRRRPETLRTAAGRLADGIGAVGLENADRSGRAYAVAVQEDHDLPHDLLLGPGTGDPLGAHRVDTGHLAQAVGLRLDHSNTFSPNALTIFLA